MAAPPKTRILRDDWETGRRLADFDPKIARK